MSRMRPTLVTTTRHTAPVGATAYLMVLNAVKESDGLAHGKLHDKGYSCAIGSYFDVNENLALHDGLIDEVAAVNDSAPHMTPKQRRLMVMRWLKWKLGSMGMPGFRSAKEPL